MESCSGSPGWERKGFKRAGAREPGRLGVADNRARNLEAEERECEGITDALQVEGIVASEDKQVAAKVPLDSWTIRWVLPGSPLKLGCPWSDGQFWNRIETHMWHHLARTILATTKHLTFFLMSCHRNTLTHLRLQMRLTHGGHWSWETGIVLRSSSLDIS